MTSIRERIGVAGGRLRRGVCFLVLPFLVIAAAFGVGSAPTSAAPLEVGCTATPHLWTPTNMTVTIGTEVKWLANCTAPHTVTSEGCIDPRYGACTFDSPQFQMATAVDSFQYTFDKPGVYPYLCRLHGAPGGRGQFGTIIVYEPGKNAPVAPYFGDPMLVQPPANTGVRITSPADGATIAGDTVEIKMAVTGATLRPQSMNIDPRFGHFHIVVDQEPDLTIEFPRAAPGIFHVTEETFTLSGMAPGVHRIGLYWGYDNHFSPVIPIFQTVRFTTTAGATVRPPSTGEAGLAADVDRYGERYIAAGIVLLGLATVIALRGRMTRPSR